ncbi:unnamed protein product [Somion occarium]|uniref:Uncharacterized protein n=1 Tax=Somion occarium TaxID=3059160 RepID=A0ABP1DJ30_9APHY
MADPSRNGVSIGSQSLQYHPDNCFASRSFLPRQSLQSVRSSATRSRLQLYRPMTVVHTFPPNSLTLYCLCKSQRFFPSSRPSNRRSQHDILSGEGFDSSTPPAFRNGGSFRI